jgi:hypothetical protein
MQQRIALALALFVWLLTFASMLTRPVASLDAASGLYAPQQRDGLNYQWTGSHVRLPLVSHSGPTSLVLSLGPARWAERSAPPVILSGSDGVLARFAAPDELRHYRMLLPPDVNSLQIDTTVEKPPGREPRWLGITIYGLEARPSGWPLGTVAQALALLPAFLLAALAFSWAVQRGFGIPLGLFGLALVLRTVLLERTPPGWRVDELVSLVDAWNLAQTGRDHLGNPLPLGAFEALGDWISPLLTYIELPFVALFGPERLVGRVVVALVGSLAAPLCYALARALGLNSAGSIAAGLAAALSPWQIFMGRIALPPALVPTFWSLCLLAGVSYIKRGDQRASLGLAFAAGVALYAYPTLKLAVPLLVGLAVMLAFLGRGAHGHPALGRGMKHWWTGQALALLVLALLWLPFGYVTLFNPASSTRLGQAALRADTWPGWVQAWWQGYSVYFLPDFYYRNGDGSSIRGVPGFGLEWWATLPLVLLGVIGLGQRLWRQHERWAHLFIVGAILLAPLAASLTLPSPHTYRAAPIAPLYALLVGYGVGVVFRSIGAQHAASLRFGVIGTMFCTLLLALALWQGSLWWRSYSEAYPSLQAGLNQDGAAEAVRRAVARAANYDEIWVSYDSIDQPYLFVLAARAFPPHEAQQLIVVERRPNRFNAVTSLGPYRFVDTSSLPLDLPTLDAVPAQSGGPGYVVQEWTDGGKQVLVVRRMLG